MKIVASYMKGAEVYKGIDQPIPLLELRDKAQHLAAIHKVPENPCWVLNDISAEEAYLILVTDNTQSELSPLEYGLHALHYVKKSKGGSGNEGGLSAYARKVGKQQPDIHTYVKGAEVAKYIDQSILLSKVQK